VKHKPQLIVLSSNQGQNNDTSLNHTSWNMTEKIHVLDDNHTGVISLKSMHFTNSFSNIKAGENVLKILSTYTVSGVATEDLTTITVPPGHYNLTSLLAHLNGVDISNRLDTYYYGFGVSGDLVNYPPFSVSGTDPAKISFHPPTAGGTGVLVYDILHSYTGFFLIVDTDTTPLMIKMGLLQTAQTGSPSNLTPFPSTTYPQLIGTNVTWDGAVDFNYPAALTVTTGTVEVFSNPNYNLIDLGGPKAIIVNIQEVHANVKTSESGFNGGNTLAVVPVTSAYGGLNTFIPDTPFPSVTPHLDINSFTVTIKDAGTGTKVDFQGVHWILTLMIEFYEIENKPLSEFGNSGEKNNILPIYHGILANHNLPNSGANDKGIVGENQLRSIKRKFM